MSYLHITVSIYKWIYVSMGMYVGAAAACVFATAAAENEEGIWL